MAQTTNVGHMSAWSLARSRGYTGTREEYAELMASYATVAEQAAESAQSASSSAQGASQAASSANAAMNNALTAESNAQSAASGAQGYAQSAQQSAQSASQSAQNAESAKETAVDAVDGFAAGAQQALDSVNSAGNNWKSLAQAQKLDAEAWATGKRDGEDVGSSDETYHNNAKYYAESAGTDATTASDAAQTATTKASEAAQSASAAAESARTLTIDATLTEEGQAADAKKVGDELSDVKDGLSTKVDTDLMQKCQLVEVPASANLWDNSSTSTGLLHTNGQVYTGGSYDSYCYYDIGEVSQGDVLTPYIVQSNGTVSVEPMARIVTYDTNGDVVPSSGASNVSTFTVPSGIASISVTMYKATADRNFMVLKNATSAPTGYIPYAEGRSWYIATEDFLPQGFAEGFVERDGEDQVTAKNAEFMFYSPNLIDESALIDGYYVSQLNGELYENTEHTVTDWISIEGGQTYTLSTAAISSWRYCFYDSTKTFISGAYVDNTLQVDLTSPANAKYFRCSTIYFRTLHAQLEKGIKTPYSVYGTAYLLEQYAPQNDYAVINLPAKIYALTGYELNIYFENLVEDWRQYSWNVDCSKGMQLERGFRITPTDADAGSYTMTITATDSTGTVTTATTTLVIAASTAGSGITNTLIVLGDSTTNNGIAATKLAQNFSDDAMGLTLYGTRGTAPYKHEGRSGWTFNYYFTVAEQEGTDVVNPFFNPTTETFDASYYFANSGISVPDWFFINLGINDMFGYTSDLALETAITTVKGLCDDMIASLKTAAPSMKIGLCLTIPPNHSQDAFGKAYKNGQTRHRYKRNNVIWVNRLIAEYDNRESEGIYLIPIHTNLDTVYNMGMETLPVNARNTAVTYQSPISNGGVHPVESGYWQIADVYTAFLKAHAED